MSTTLQQDTLVEMSAEDPPSPWADWLKRQPWQIWVEFAFNDARQKIAANSCTTFGEIKIIICQNSCCDPAKITLWWMGEEMRDELTLADALSWRRAAASTTFHCTQLPDCGVKRSRRPCS